MSSRRYAKNLRQALKGGEGGMKLTMSRIAQGEDEVIIKYREMNEQIETIAGMVQGIGRKISASADGRTFLLQPEDILYLESVDGVTWAYLENQVCRVQTSLLTASACYENRGFFRCSKSMVINIYRISFLESKPGSRICATMENGEKVMISRRYAKNLRQVLKGGEGRDEEQDF
ncbi:MAG: LytTR family transcriptional regulator DNA-binding domain-containing protein [Clostridium sp.]|nr:LytTR family transcriptional regulator DNA-binding domain-containing protein [Clostridium sp.]